jgi:NAD(P)H-nitrite reductase large subunit
MSNSEPTDGGVVDERQTETGGDRKRYGRGTHSRRNSGARRRRTVPHRNGRLIGGILLGDAARAANLLSAVDSSTLLPEERISLLFDIGAPAARGAFGQIPLETQICSCTGLRMGALLECIKTGLGTAEAVMEATRAGKTCGSWEPAVRETSAGHAAKQLHRHRPSCRARMESISYSKNMAQLSRLSRFISTGCSTI